MHAADSDSDPEESDRLGPEGVYYAQRLKLRLELRRWEGNFLAANEREPDYEDKKLNPRYQQLRSKLRQVEIEWRAQQQREGHEGGDTSRSGHSSRSGVSGTQPRRGSSRAIIICCSFSIRTPYASESGTTACPSRRISPAASAWSGIALVSEKCVYSSRAAPKLSTGGGGTCHGQSLRTGGSMAR